MQYWIGTAKTNTARAGDGIKSNAAGGSKIGQLTS